MEREPIDLSPYDTFAAVLRAGGFVAPADPNSWSAELVAAHVIKNNDFWTETARQVVAGETPTYDNEPAVDVAELTRVVAEIGDLAELAAEVERSAADLASAHAALTDEQAEQPVLVRIHHEGDLIIDEPRPVASMLVGNATFHQQMHFDQLLALRG